ETVGVSGNVGNDLPIRVCGTGSFDLECLLATDRCPAKRDVTVEINLTILLVRKVGGNCLGRRRLGTFRKVAGNRDVSRDIQEYLPATRGGSASVNAHVGVCG